MGKCGSVIRRVGLRPLAANLQRSPYIQQSNEALAHAYNTQHFDGYLGAGFWDDAVFDIYVI